MGAFTLEGSGGSTPTLRTTTSGEQYVTAPFFEPLGLAEYDVYTTTPNLNDVTKSMTHAMACWSEHVSWAIESISWYNAVVAHRTWPTTYSTEVYTRDPGGPTKIYPSGLSIYTLCDGFPRVNAALPTFTELNLTTETVSYGPYPLEPTYRPPPCTPSAQDCELLYVNSNVTWWNSYLNGMCGFPVHVHPGGDVPCIFNALGAVQMSYLPVAEGDLCTPNRSTIAPAYNGTEQMTNGHTFASGFVYISVSSLYAYYDGFDGGGGSFAGATIGPNFKNITLTVKSEDMSSHCYGDLKPTSLNFADLNWPVPASAYSCQLGCAGYASPPPECSTIWSDVNPYLAIPTKALKALVPEWSECVAGNGNQRNYWFDPPVALHQTDVVAGVTTPSSPSTTPAAPSSTPRSPYVDWTTSRISDLVTSTAPEVLQQGQSVQALRTAQPEDSDDTGSATSTLDQGLTDVASVAATFPTTHEAGDSGVQRSVYAAGEASSDSSDHTRNSEATQTQSNAAAAVMSILAMTNTLVMVFTDSFEDGPTETGSEQAFDMASSWSVTTDAHIVVQTRTVVSGSEDASSSARLSVETVAPEPLRSTPAASQAGYSCASANAGYWVIGCLTLFLLSIA
ncbi:hypothetical protein LTR97_001733 [Elasticomyces elasticus]|uniref:Uncharacterized protein n=1 Tax=Elasticomyces elasticus TaxID=574655 RepID=A0AAN7WCR8_9PEZI|nr:hypothetical protein LTR97_001733 [Elasticomyces elasticus]